MVMLWLRASHRTSVSFSVSDGTLTINKVLIFLALIHAKPSLQELMIVLSFLGTSPFLYLFFFPSFKISPPLGSLTNLKDTYSLQSTRVT